MIPSKPILLLLLALVCSQTSQAQTYVNATATGANDGSSWADAYTTLHAALETYSAGDEIWVAAGTYVPQQPSAWTGDPKRTFYLYQDVALYGGFNGTETLRSERDPSSNVTILSGDVSGDDILGDLATNRGDNVINVVFVDSIISNATVIDGFTISGGHADGDTSSLYNSLGGGIWSWGSPHIRRCHVTQNYAEEVAGGMYLRGQTSAEGMVSDCLFENNQAGRVGGGLTVVTLDSSKTVQVDNCRFVGNQATNIGGGIAIGSSSVSMRYCEFVQNSVDLAGGGIYYAAFTDFGGNYRLTLNTCGFVDNSAGEGGGFYYETDSQGDNDMAFDSCTFLFNKAVGTALNEFPDGGAMEFVYYDGAPTNDSVSIRNCLFQGNQAERITGAINIIDGSAGNGNVFDIHSSRFIQNSSPLAAGAVSVLLYNDVQNYEVRLTDCAFEENTAQFGGAIHYETNSIGNHLISFASCEFIANHSTGNSLGNITDGGALNVFYFQGAVTHDSVLISDCLFQDNTSETRGGAITLDSEVGSDNVFSIRNSRFVRDSAGREGGAIFVKDLQAATDLQFDLVDCLFEGNVSSNGGGMKYICQGQGGNHVNITRTDWIDNQAIENQFGDAGGGGIFFFYPGGTNPQNDTIQVEDCLFQGNSSAFQTGGLSYTHFGGQGNHLQVDNCEFVGNEEQSGNAVGGLGITEGGTNMSVLVQNTRFSGNIGQATAAFGVGGSAGLPAPQERQIDLINCLFTGHNANPASSVVLGTNRGFSLMNCTVADNQNPSLGVYESGRITLQSTILDTDGTSNLVPAGQAGTPIISRGGNLISDGALDAFLDSTDQSDTDPMFVMGTYQLSHNSPAIDAGIVPYSPPATDLDSNNRIQGGCIDIGALESPYDLGLGCIAMNPTTSLRAPLTASVALSLYPNPAVNTLTVSLAGMRPMRHGHSLTLHIVNALGQVVQTADMGQRDSMELDIHSLPAGTYRVLVSDGQQMTVASLVKQ